MEKERSPGEAKDIVDAFREAGDTTLTTKAVTTVARFAIRKLAMVLDVKASHDVFGEAIAFALALHAATRAGKVQAFNGEAVGRAIHRALGTVGTAPLSALTQSAKDAFSAGNGVSTMGPRISAAIGKHVDGVYGQLERAMAAELR